MQQIRLCESKADKIYFGVSHGTVYAYNASLLKITDMFKEPVPFLHVSRRMINNSARTDAWLRPEALAHVAGIFLQTCACFAGGGKHESRRSPRRPEFTEMCESGAR